MAVTTDITGEWTRRSQTMIAQAVGRGTGLLADRVEHYTTIAREVGDILRERGEPQAADLAATLAERTQSVARYLRNTDGSRILSDVQEFARGRGWLLTGVGLISGLALARAVRSAADAAQPASQSSSSRGEEYFSQDTGSYPSSEYAQRYSQR